MPSPFGPMTLGELIDVLEEIAAKPRGGERTVYFDWCQMRPGQFESYRGFYDHLALGIHADRYMIVGGMLAACKGAVGRVYMGWKGGEYRMDKDTPVWVANPGEATGWGIAGVKDDGYSVILETKRFDG
jgi:hypothetical protein